MDLKHSVERPCYVPFLALPALRTSRFQHQLGTWSGILVRFYRAIQRVSGAQVIVDSSKSPFCGYLLSAIPEIELHVIHLVRDSRAVAYSWQRKICRPEVYWKSEMMPIYSLAKTSRLWILKNCFIEGLRFPCKRYGLIRYEDMVRCPGLVLKQILRGLTAGRFELPVLKGRTIGIGVNHTESGNPIRFRRGLLDLQVDDELRLKMPRRQKNYVMTTTWLLLLRYRYPLFANL